eukprot:4541397-Prymnesium_polylepis.1
MEHWSRQDGCAMLRLVVVATAMGRRARLVHPVPHAFVGREHPWVVPVEPACRHAQRLDLEDRKRALGECCVRHGRAVHADDRVEPL